MTGINKRGQQPKFGPLAGKIPRRSAFLSGAQKAYFGAGQAPDGMDDTFLGYRKPTAWNAANSLLRVPQMVWLSLAPIDCVSTDTDTTPSSIIPNYTLAPDAVPPGEADYQPGPIYRCGTSFNFGRIYYWNDGHTEIVEPSGGGFHRSDYTPGDEPYIVDSGGFTGDDYAGVDSGHIGRQPTIYSGYTRSVVNWNYREYQRILPIFQEVKTRIEALRPTLTYIDIVDYNDSTKWPNDRFQNGGVQPGNRYGFIVAPDPSETFFGTNFLHIYTGGNASFEPSVPPTDDYNADISLDGTYIACKAQIMGSYPKFSGYNVYLYVIGKNLQQVKWANAPVITSIDAPPCDNLEILGVDPIAYPPPLNQVNVINIQRQGTIDFENNKITGYATNFNTTFSVIASDLSAFGYHYSGDSELITVDSMIALIASNFRFNPITGRDL